jgi:hypothetical protein
LCFVECIAAYKETPHLITPVDHPHQTFSTITNSMAHATGREWDVTPPDHGKSEYGFQKEINADAHDVQIYTDPDHKDESLHRGLKARQISMIAIGGAVGKSKRMLPRNDQANIFKAPV